MKLAQRSTWRQPAVRQPWGRYAGDSALAVAGVALITAVISLAHLYPRITIIAFVYLLVVVALASIRGISAAIPASLLSFLCFDFFFFPPRYAFLVSKGEDLFTLVVFLTTAVITGQLASALRRRAEQASRREREVRHLYEQTQELVALQERQRLARELHDSVSQVLYSIGMGTHTVREILEAGGDREEALESIDYVLSLADAGLVEMRALIFELRPESLEREGLVAALTRQVAVLRARYKLTVEAQLGEEPQLPLEVKHVLYRVAQEALNNIVKHARATTVVLRLAREAGEIIVEVRDNGRGFDPAGPFPGHLGLPSMRERVAKAGGFLTIESVLGRGTRVDVRLPVAPES